MARKATIPAQVRRVAAYLRCSTEEQGNLHAFGLAAQQAAIEAHCQREGLELVGIYTDSGISGTKDATQRPGLAAVLALAATQQVDGIIVKSLDRVGRSIAVIANTLETIQRFGVSFISTQEPALNSPLVLSVYIGLAAEERSRIVARTASGRVAKASAGGVVGKAAYGYQIVGTRKDARLEVIEDQAAVVRGIFAARVAGQPYSVIADHLNEQGVPSPSGKQWHVGPIHHIVHNTAYTGSRTWTENGETHTLTNPVIVDQEVWEQAQ